MRKGFTIVELLIYLGLLGIFLTILTEVFLSVLDVQVESVGTSSVQQDGAFILARLSYDAARATTVAVPGSLGATTPSLTLTVGGLSYVYNLSGTDLVLTVGSGPARRLNNSETEISGLTFSRYGNLGGRGDTLRVAFTAKSLAKRTGAGPETRDYQTTVGLRFN